MASVDDAVALILGRRAATSARRALLVAVSGIDGSGKGHITAAVAAQLARHLPGVVSINIDGWLHLPQRRFSQERPAEHFYEQGIRFQEMFQQLVLPLKEQRSLRLEADLSDATNLPEYRRHVYEFDEVRVILLEGIFLLKRAFRDCSTWREMPHETPPT